MAKPKLNLRTFLAPPGAALAEASATLAGQGRAGGFGSLRRRTAVDPAPASRTTDPRVPLGHPLPPSVRLLLLLQPLLFWLEALRRSFRESLGRTWSRPERWKGQRKGKGGIGGVGGGRERGRPGYRNLPRSSGWGRWCERGGRGPDHRGVCPRRGAAARLTPGGGKRDPPSGGARALPRDANAAAPYAAQDLPCARRPGDPRGFPFLPRFAGGEVTCLPPRRGKERIARGAPKPRAGAPERAPRGALCASASVSVRARAAWCVWGGPVSRGRSAGDQGPRAESR